MSRRVARRWQVRDEARGPAEGLVRELGVSPRVAGLLVQRGLAGAEEAARFLKPGWDQLCDPFLLADMRRACEAVHGAIARGELITLYGDYDVDGTTACVILYWVVKKLGGKVRIQIPDRREDGYGLTRAGLAKVAAAGSKLVVTVDHGVAARDEVAEARALGIEVVITDHHALPAVLPDAAAVVHPARPGQDYPNRHLCGAGVGMKLGQALLATAPAAAVREAGRDFLEACLDLVALATIADMTALTGENRALVALGLERMGRSKHPGLTALLREAGRGNGRPTVDDVGFGVAPLVNAGARIAGPELALACLLERDPAKAASKAAELGRLNVTRRELTEDLLEAAVARAADWAGERIGVVALDSDATGIVGLVAGRLKDMYWKPFVVFARRGDELVGSARSVDGFDVRAALASCAGELLRFGGHAQAAGATLRPERFPALADGLRAHAREHLDPALLEPRLGIDAKLGVGDLSWELLDEVEQLAPFGVGNPAPLFMIEGCPVERIRPIGRTGSHVKLVSKGMPAFVDTVGFHLRDRVDPEMEARGGRLDLAFSLSRDEWMGRPRLKLRLEDLRAGN